MKLISSILLALLQCCIACAQQENMLQHSLETEQQLESLAEEQDAEPEDDSYLQTLLQYKKHKLNLNTVEGQELKQLHLVSELNIQSFLSYRKLLGSLLSIYELQAIPGWNLETIQRVLPYVTVNNELQSAVSLGDRYSNGQHSLLLRWQQNLEKSNGFLRPGDAALRYPGSNQKILFRYKYAFRNLLQFGITGEKDAGEQFFNGAQKQGFDFYSIHIFARKLGWVKFLALGDFTVNLGQGLIHWQSLAFKKSAEITSVKRQADILRPYNSPGEFNFMRGAGITVGNKTLELTCFGSVHKIDGNINVDTFQTNTDYISSLVNSGFHRTTTEIAKKNAVTQNSVGGNFSFSKNSFHIGVNAIAFTFSNTLNRRISAYNQYAIQGNRWSNYSIDYSYTLKNIHFFGELASDKNQSKAFVGGMLASVDAKVDVSAVYRNIEQSYQTLYGNAFTENTSPTNEKGLFTGLSLRPLTFLKIDAYADVFSFPWLKYRVDAPSSGSGYLLQVSYTLRKQVEIYTRFKNDNKPGNLSATDFATRHVYITPKASWRTHVNYEVSKEISFNQRVEVLWFDHIEKTKEQQGFLIYFETKYKPAFKPFSLNTRLQYFDTDGFDSRIYAYESDLLYSYSIPQFIGKGLRYYVNAKFDLSTKMTMWARWSQTIYTNQTYIGSGLDKIDGNKRSEIKFQLLYNF